MSKRWHTADLHIGHGLVSVMRGFTTPEEHDEALVEEWQSKVGKDDHVWVLVATIHQWIGGSR